MLRKSVPARLVAVVSSLVLFGCMCEGVGCLVNSVHEIKLESDKAVWPPGSYEVTVLVDGETTTCKVSFPMVGCPSTYGACYGGRSGTVQFGCDGSGNGVSLSSVTVGGAVHDKPLSVSAELKWDGKQIASTTHSSPVERIFPNGERCEPSCLVSTPTVFQVNFPDN